MAIESRSKVLGNHEYKVTQLDAIKGRRAFVRLGNAIGPAFKSAQGGGLDVLAQLVGGMKVEDVDYFCDVFSEYTEVAGGEYEKPRQLVKGVFMTHFAGNYMEMVEWLIFACEVNFSSFFDGLKDLLPKVSPEAAKQPSLTSPTT